MSFTTAAWMLRYNIGGVSALPFFLFAKIIDKGTLI